MVSQLCAKELKEDQRLERLNLSGWPGIHMEMCRGDVQVRNASSGAGAKGGETQSSGEEIIEGRMETEDGAETPGWRKGASLENRGEDQSSR